MESEDRRKQIIDILTKASSPVTGTELSKKCQVSRQIIVGDVALLRARGISIISTPRGYQLDHAGHVGIQRMIVVCHGPEQMRAELEAIVHLIEADTEADIAAIEGALDKLGILYNP